MSYSRYFQAVPELWRLLQDRYPSLIQMKPLLVLVTAIASGTSLSVLSQHPGFADAGHVQAPFLLASAPATQSRLWVKVSTRSTLQDIAADLGLSNSELTALNDQASQDTIKPGAWIVIPADAEESLASATRLDGTTVLRKAPLQTPPAPGNAGRAGKLAPPETVGRIARSALGEALATRTSLPIAKRARSRPGFNERNSLKLTP